MNERKQSAAVKLKLLVNGIKDDPKLFFSLGNFKEEHYAYDNGNWGVTPNRRIPVEVMLPGEIVSKVHIRPESSLHFLKDGEQLYIAEGSKILTPCHTLSKPVFWNYQTTRKISTKRYANFYGKNCLNFNIYSGCQFFHVGMQCRFCSVENTQKTQKQV